MPYELTYLINNHYQEFSNVKRKCNEAKKIFPDKDS